MVAVTVTPRVAGVVTIRSFVLGMVFLPPSFPCMKPPSQLLVCAPPSVSLAKDGVAVEIEAVNRKRKAEQVRMAACFVAKFEGSGDAASAVAEGVMGGAFCKNTWRGVQGGRVVSWGVRAFGRNKDMRQDDCSLSPFPSPHRQRRLQSC